MSIEISPAGTINGHPLAPTQARVHRIHAYVATLVAAQVQALAVRQAAQTSPHSPAEFKEPQANSL